MSKKEIEPKGTNLPQQHEKDKDLIHFDWEMKRLLRDKANPVVLEGFLTSLLGKQVKIVDFLESEGNRRYDDEKTNRVDILAVDSDDNKIIIEVQNETESAYFHRILFGTSRLIIDHVKKGEGYEKVPKVYSVNIIFFNIGDRSDYVYHGVTDFKGLHTGEPLQLPPGISRKFDVTTPGEILPEYYILIANDFNRWSKTPLDQWMYFLGTNTIPKEADAPGLQEAREQLAVDRLSKADQEAYYKHLDNVRSVEDAIETAFDNGKFEGRAEGRAEEKWEIAESLRKMGLPLSQIAEATKIPIDQLQSRFKE